MTHHSDSIAAGNILQALFTPSFSIWDSNRGLKPGIHCAFLSRETIDMSAFTGYLFDAKGRKYTVHFDFDVDAVAVPADFKLTVIVSYQQRVEGAFAVVRLLDKKHPKARNVNAPSNKRGVQKLNASQKQEKAQHDSQ